MQQCRISGTNTTYERTVKRLLSDTERIATEAEIAAARKAQVVYFVSLANGFVAFIEIYAKNAKEDPSDADKKDIKAAVKELTAAFGPDGSR